MYSLCMAYSPLTWGSLRAPRWGLIASDDDEVFLKARNYPHDDSSM